MAQQYRVTVERRSGGMTIGKGGSIIVEADDEDEAREIANSLLAAGHYALDAEELEDELSRWGVWCEVWGGITGSREAWMKRDGKIARFVAREEAEAEAAKWNTKNNGPYRSASFRYTARRFDD